MMDWEGNSWYLSGLIATAHPRGALVARPISWADLKPAVSVPDHDFDLYLDVVESAALLFSDGLEACGLAYQMMINEPFRALRANCHPVVSDETMVRTQDFIRGHIVVRREGNRLMADGDREMHAIAGGVKRRAASARPVS